MENENNGVQGMPQGATPESEAQAAPEAVQQVAPEVAQTTPQPQPLCWCCLSVLHKRDGSYCAVPLFSESHLYGVPVVLRM